MSKYNNTVITKAGLDLITAAGSGQAGFKITKAETTATDLSATDLSTLTAMPDVVQTGSIVGSDESTVGVLGIKVQFDNTHVSKSYSANAIGVYATGADGKQILYAVTTAETGHAQYIPDYAGGVKLDFGITINIVIGAATNVTVQFDTDGLATIGFVEDAVAGLTNVAKTDTVNTFTKPQTFRGGALDASGNSYITLAQVPKTDLTPYTPTASLTQLLAAKANQTDMTTKLAGKADVTDMTTKLAAKADTATVNAQIGTRVQDNKNGTITVNGVVYTPVKTTELTAYSNTTAMNTAITNAVNTAKTALTTAYTNAITAAKTELNGNINTAKQAAINQIQPMITAEFTKRNAPSAWWNGTAAQYAAVTPKVATVEYNVYE